VTSLVQSVVGKTLVVSDTSGWLATFTVGSRTVTLRGAARTLAEPNVAATVRTNVYVRLLPVAFGGVLDPVWLKSALASTGPDVLKTALQYVYGAPTVRNSAGVRIAGDANYGPLLSDGTRQEGSDFNDYMGVKWTYGSTVDAPESNQYGSLDCSGYVRMVYGYRWGFGLTLNPDGKRLPRRAVWMAGSTGPGVTIVVNSGAQASVSAAIRPGDLVFFDAATDDGTAIDHVGIYLGRDTGGHARFISSRKKPNGPTLGDVGGTSVLDGTGHYAKSFRSVRRL
jgi:cell wall-associated NlpC family hydrolase